MYSPVDSILWNHRGGASDLKFEFSTKDLVKEKRYNALDGQKAIFDRFELFQVGSRAAVEAT